VFSIVAKQMKGPRSRGLKGPDTSKAHAMRIQHIPNKKSGICRPQRSPVVCLLERDPMVCLFLASRLGQPLLALSRSSEFCAASTMPGLSKPRRAERGWQRHYSHIKTEQHSLELWTWVYDDLRLPSHIFDERAA
jgi:hypothetical protein